MKSFCRCVVFLYKQSIQSVKKVPNGCWLFQNIRNATSQKIVFCLTITLTQGLTSKNKLLKNFIHPKNGQKRHTSLARLQFEQYSYDVGPRYARAMLVAKALTLHSAVAAVASPARRAWYHARSCRVASFARRNAATVCTAAASGEAHTGEKNIRLKNSWVLVVFFTRKPRSRDNN